MSEKKNIDEFYNRDQEEYARFSSMLSKSVHDINNPLAVFIGQLSIIDLLQKRDQLDAEKINKILEKLKSSSQTLKERIERLRNFYKAPINDVHFSRVENAIASACYLLENEAYLSDITLHAEHVPELKSSVSTGKIFLVCKHLIQNAIESLKKCNQDEKKIDVISRQIDNSIEISIADNGPGLSCELNTAAELGYTTKENKTGGTGLAMAKKILDEHHITLHYAKGRFFFTIPIKTEEL